MRYILAVAPFAVAVAAQDLSITGLVQTATISSAGEALYTSTWTYSNPATNYLTETDSDGVVTGVPSNTAVVDVDQPEVVTSQPPVATIPAGLPTGVTYIAINATSGYTSFQVSVGSSTTVVLGGAVGTDASVTTGSVPAPTGSGSSSSGSDSDSSDSGSDSDSSSSDESASASASESGNAASSVRVAGAGIGLFAFIAALL